MGDSPCTWAVGKEEEKCQEKCELRKIRSSSPSAFRGNPRISSVSHKKSFFRQLSKAVKQQ